MYFICPDVTTLYRARTEYESEFDRFLKTPRTGTNFFKKTIGSSGIRICNIRLESCKSIKDTANMCPKHA